MATVSINPALTTAASGLFSVTEAGLVQGTAYDDPATRNALAGGVIDPTETLPMWGGCGIYENLPLLTAGSTTASSTFGGYFGRATNVTANTAKTLTGFSVFDQAHNWINTPQSPVPLGASGMTGHFYRMGSNARIAVKVAPSLVSLDGGIILPQVSWDFAGQQLVPYAVANPGATITGATWASTAGGQATFTVGTDMTSFFGAGDYLPVTGVVSTGGTGAGYNGSWIIVSIAAGNVVVSMPAASSVGTYSSGGTVPAAGGALSVKVLQVQIGGCKTVSYDLITGFATWSNDGNCAVIQI